MGYCIYKIVCDDVPDYIYIGSTSNFTNRKCNHKSRCNNINAKKYNQKLYSTIRENGGWDNWRIVIINECEEGITKTQAHIIEEEFRVKLNANLNMVKCFTTEEEKEEYNKEERKEYYKEYYKENKEKKKEYSKEYSENNKEKRKEKITCECGCKICKMVLLRHQKSKKHIDLMEKQNETK